MTPTRLVRNASAGAVAAIAAAASYTHMRTLAAEHGQSAPIAAMVPLSVDGLMVVATIAMHDDKHTGRPVRRSAWLAFVVGVTASVTANVLSAPDNTTARVISAWPAVALLLVVELLARTGRTPTRQAEDRQADETPQSSTGDARTWSAAPDLSSGPSVPERVRGSSRTEDAATPAEGDCPDRSAPAATDRPEDRAGEPANGPSLQKHPARTASRASHTLSGQSGDTGAGPDVSDLLGPGRAVRNRLAADGAGLTRRTLIEGLRADGHTVSTARASALLRQLAAEPHPAPTTSDTTNTDGQDSGQDGYESDVRDADAA